MSDRSRGAAAEFSAVLIELDDEYVQLLSSLDRRTAFKGILAALPDAAGVDVAFIGELQDDDSLALGLPTNFRTPALDGLIVPAGIGLGGRVMLTRVPEWVPNYPASANLLQPFAREANLEGLKGMAAVPIVHGDRLLGVLYGADRSVAEYGDVTLAALERLAGRAAGAAAVAERVRTSAEVAVHEERRRIGLQLHDTVGAMLFTIGARMRRLTESVQDDHELHAQLETLQRQTVEAAGILREALRAFEASPESIALPIALREDCRAFEDRTGIPARLLVLDELPVIHSSRSRALGEAVREALLNVEKHAAATSVLVTVFCTDEGISIAVADDGCGLPADLEPGLGLAATVDRLGRLGGSFSLGANDDGGVTVRAWVPG